MGRDQACARACDGEVGLQDFAQGSSLVDDQVDAEYPESVLVSSLVHRARSWMRPTPPDQSSID